VGKGGSSTREQSEQESVLSVRGRSIGLARRLGKGGVNKIGFVRAKGAIITSAKAIITI
jgi:hypothetical protein